MNILRQFTLRSLKKNRVRTLVTIIGILLSVALFTAVAEGAYSGQQYLVRVAEAGAGSWHGVYYDVTAEELAQLSDQAQVERAETLTGVGWALAAPDQDFYPYLRISAMSAGLQELAPLHLKEGRLPERADELLISDALERTCGLQWTVGQTVTLEVGHRYINGAAAEQNEPYQGERESLEDVQTAAYTVVGVYNRFPSTLEAYSMPGSLALTVGPAGEPSTVLFTLDRINDCNSFLSTHRFGSGGEGNRDLMLVSGASGNRNLVEVLYGLIAILFGLIAFGSVALIYNSFSISVSERTKQFGLLKSVGASNRQILGAVLTEGLLLCAVGIPLGLLVGCGGIGLTLRLLKGQFDLLMGSGTGNDSVSIRLVLSAPALLAAAGMGLLTTLISAWIPARRAMGISPIQAIRQSGDLRVSRREVKVSALTRRLFGVPGMLASKNFKRNRKQYRSTVISLFLSIVLFVSASALAGYLRQDVAGSGTQMEADLMLQLRDAPEEDPEDLLRQLLTVDGITEGAWAVPDGTMVQLPAAALTEEAAQHTSVASGTATDYYTLWYISEADYAALCREAGTDPAAGRLLVWNTKHTYDFTESGAVYVTYELLKASALPVSAELVDEAYGGPGTELVDVEYGPDGSIQYYCFREECRKTGPVTRLTPEQAERRTPVEIGGLLEHLPLASSNQDQSLYLPISALPEGRPQVPAFFFRAPNHSAAKENLEARLRELGLHATVEDTREGKETTRAILLILDVFTYGFIVLISLIAAANVFNTISTNISLRRRELAMLRSVGMSQRDFGRMMRFECLLYGCKALLWGLPVSLGVTWLIARAVSAGFQTEFRPPWAAMGIAAVGVFAIVGLSMLYAMRRLRRENIVETLRNDNI